MATMIWQNEGSEQKSSFWSVGHRPTLIAAFLYFDLAFMVWVLLGPLAPDIAKALALTPAEKGLMVATPTLAGAVLRVVNGLLVDRIGPKRSGAISQIIVIVGLLSAWLMGVSSFGGTLALGVILGFAGASFAIALPLASRWYPAEHQGRTPCERPDAAPRLPASPALCCTACARSAQVVRTRALPPGPGRT